MLIQKSSSVSTVVPFSSSAINNLWHASQQLNGSTIAGVSSDGTFGWLAKGGVLEVFGMQTGERWAAWYFGSAGPDLKTVISAVCQFGTDCSAACLAVATAQDDFNSFKIYLFDICKSSIVKVVQLPFLVTALETVFSDGPNGTYSCVLSQHLMCFCGILAAGTRCGHIYLIDMCLDTGHVSSELQAASLSPIDPSRRDVVTERYKAVCKGHHACLQLAEDADDDEYFGFRKPNGEVSCYLPSDDVSVTCIYFMKNTGLLAIGFSFGCFQLWRLNIPVLEFSSRFDEEIPSIVSFTYQEPENDPRHFGYLWVVRGPTALQSVSRCTSFLNLYQLGFAKKVWYDGFGFVFQDLTGMWVRFEHDLYHEPFTSQDAAQSGSRVIACRTLTDWRYTVRCSPADNECSVDENSAADLGLSMFAWEAVCPNGIAGKRCFLALFDMNRWYNAQMPEIIRESAGSYETCPYWSVCSLDDVVQALAPDRLLMLDVNYGNLSRFSPTCPSADPQVKYFQPSALSFKASAVSKCGIIHLHFAGFQRQVLGDIARLGPEVLLNATELYAMCVDCGLIPAYPLHTLTDKRESVLSMALEHGLVGFITACISQWSTAEFVSESCTMRCLLDWSWKCVSQLKENVDKLFEPLYDWSGRTFSDQEFQMLRHYQITLRHLITIFDGFCSCSSTATESGKQELELKLGAVHLVCEYVDVVMWFLSVCLLPEHPEDVVLNDCEYAFPASDLSSEYRHLRKSVEHSHRHVNTSHQLVIDQLFEHEACPVKQLFSQHSSGPLYPPSSFQALLSIYLLPDVTSHTKQIILLYSLCDLINLASSEASRTQMEQKFEHFCKTFAVAPSLAKFVRAVWLLDHRSMPEASVMFADSSIHCEITGWLHSAIVRTFLSAGCEKHALAFIATVNLPMLTTADVELRLTVLLANGLISEALEYQRCCNDKSTSEQLMSHIIRTSVQSNQVDQLLHLTLKPTEMEHIVSYLKNVNKPMSHDLLVLHYLQQSKFTDAIQLEAVSSATTRVGSCIDRARATIVDGYRRAVPSVQHRYSQYDARRSLHTVRNEYVRPEPLSAAVVDSNHTSVITRAKLLAAVLDKVKEVKTDRALPASAPCEDESSNFLFGTPIVPRSSAKKRGRDASEVVYPLVDKNAATEAVSMTPLYKTLQSYLASGKLNSKSSAILSVLQTPPVVHKTASLLRDAGPTVSVTKPQSILSAARHKTNAAASTAIRLTWDEATVFSPENASMSQNELHAEAVRNSRLPPVERFHVSNLDSTDENMDQTEPCPAAGMTSTEPFEDEFTMFDEDISVKMPLSISSVIRGLTEVRQSVVNVDDQPAADASLSLSEPSDNEAEMKDTSTASQSASPGSSIKPSVSSGVSSVDAAVLLVPTDVNFNNSSSHTYVSENEVHSDVTSSLRRPPLFHRAASELVEPVSADDETGPSDAACTDDDAPSSRDAVPPTSEVPSSGYCMVSVNEVYSRLDVGSTDDFYVANVRDKVPADEEICTSSLDAVSPHVTALPSDDIVINDHDDVVNDAGVVGGRTETAGTDFEASPSSHEAVSTLSVNKTFAEVETSTEVLQRYVHFDAASLPSHQYDANDRSSLLSPPNTEIAGETTATTSEPRSTDIADGNTESGGAVLADVSSSRLSLSRQLMSEIAASVGISATSVEPAASQYKELNAETMDVVESESEVMMAADGASQPGTAACPSDVATVMETAQQDVEADETHRVTNEVESDVDSSVQHYTESPQRQMPGTPETPTRRSVRLLAKQLYEEELMESPQLTKDTEKHLRRTPEHGRPDTELKHTASRSSARKPRKDMDEKTASESETESAGKPDVVVTPPQMSMHSHFLDSRQLNRTDLATDAEKSPRRKSSRGSPSRREVTESVRRSPRLTAKRDNLLMESPQPTKTNPRQSSALKSDRKRNSAQKSPSTKPDASSVSSVSAEVLMVRRPLMQDDDSDDNLSEADQLATSQVQPTASSKQALTRGTPSVDELFETVSAAAASSLDGDKVEVDAANSLSRRETRTSRKRQMQGRTLSPISDEHDETSADEPEPRRSKRNRVADETVLLLSPIPTQLESDSKRKRSSSSRSAVTKLSKQKAQRRSRQLNW